MCGGIITIKQFDVVEEKKGLKLYSYDEIIEKCDVDNGEIIRDILSRYEFFRQEVEKQINDDSKEFLEIECNGHIHRNIILTHFWGQNIKLMKNQIKKVEYFKGCSSAVRIELYEGDVYFH